MPKTKENIFKSRIELNYNITYRKVFTVEIYSLYTRKNLYLLLLKRGRMESLGNDDVWIVHAHK